MIPIVPASVVILRLFGVRDAVLAGVLWTADSKDAERRALMTGALIDGIDVLSVGVSFLEGNFEGLPALWVGGGAAFFVALALVSL